MPEPPLTIRRAAPCDVDDLVALINRAYGRTDEEAGWTSEEGLIAGPRIDAERVRGLREAPGSLLLAGQQSDALVGCVHLETHDDAEGDVELGLLSVDPAVQASGLGSRLLSQAESYAAETLGAQRIVLHVVSRRQELVAWYERRGYQPTGHREPFEPFGGQRFLQGPLAFEVLVKELV